MTKEESFPAAIKSPYDCENTVPSAVDSYQEN